MLSNLATYEDCLHSSEKVYWNLADEVEKLQFDFTKPFLAEKLAGTAEITCLDAYGKLKLNQIRGYTYVHLFLFVEEFILEEVSNLAKDHLHKDEIAARALYRFV